MEYQVEMKQKFRLILITVISMLLVGCGHIYEQGRQIFYANQEVSQSVFAMDTYMTVTAYGAYAKEAVSASIEEINRLDALLSTGNEKSEISALNHEHGGKLSKDTAYLWEKSYEIFSMTGGAFDVTIYPVMEAWGFAGGEKQIPKENLLDKLLQKVDSDLVNYDVKQASIVLPDGVKLDFGGIAKGYTSERVIRLMKESGVKSAMVNLGGNVQILGEKPDGSKYRVAVKNPKNDGTYLGILEIADKAVITSGGYERFFEENGEVYHHIIDPKTGFPANKGLSSVTIVSDDATLADGLSTSLFIMGLDESISFWRNHSDKFDAILCTTEGKIIVTQGLADCFQSEQAIQIVKK